MPLRVTIAYILIALVAALLAALYLYMTRERRAYGRAARAYRRVRKAANRRA